LHIQQLQINVAYFVMRQAEKAGDAWLPQDPSPYPAASEPGGLYQINMMSASAPTVNIDIDSEDEDEDEAPMIDVFDTSRINKSLSNNRTASELCAGLAEIEKVLYLYSRTLREPFGSILHQHALMWVYRERYASCSITPYPNAPIVLRFNWVQQHDTIRTLSPLLA
jgi:hypothetical protein